MENQQDIVFYDLPQALIEEMLGKCGDVSSSLVGSFNHVRSEKDVIRRKLLDVGLLQRDANLASFPFNPTTCGIDGAFALDRLLSTDLVAVAALGVEGLTPPTEKRLWPNPRHYNEMLPVPHNDATPSLLRALMMCFEVRLAAAAPHDVIMMDGSLTSPMIALNQALSYSSEASPELVKKLYSVASAAAGDILGILESKRSDKIWVAVPKYTERSEVTSKVLGMEGYEDRGMLSFVLEAGDFVGPLDKVATSEPRNIDRLEGQAGFLKRYIERVSDLKIVYYRPFNHMPALRLEVPGSVVRNNQRLAMLFEAIRIQCGAASIFEPYPLYLADRMVKHLGSIMPALRRTTTQRIAESWGDDLGSAFLAMHGYRTESG